MVVVDVDVRCCRATLEQLSLAQALTFLPKSAASFELGYPLFFQKDFSFSRQTGFGCCCCCSVEIFRFCANFSSSATIRLREPIVRQGLPSKQLSTLLLSVTTTAIAIPSEASGPLVAFSQHSGYADPYPSSPVDSAIHSRAFQRHTHSHNGNDMPSKVNNRQAEWLWLPGGRFDFRLNCLARRVDGISLPVV